MGLLKFGKDIGVKITGEVCPHHFTFTDEDILSLNTNFKMNPPLRGKRCPGYGWIKRGTIDVIATDHAPHHKDEKMQVLLRHHSV